MEHLMDPSLLGSDLASLRQHRAGQVNSNLLESLTSCVDMIEGSLVSPALDEALIGATTMNQAHLRLTQTVHNLQVLVQPLQTHGAHPDEAWTTWLIDQPALGLANEKRLTLSRRFAMSMPRP